MEKPWHNQYPAETPHEIDMSSCASVVELFTQASSEYASLPAFENFGTQISFQELNDLSANFARYLQNSIGLKKGERVAVMMPNLLQYPIAIFGILRAGGVVVNTNPMYTPRELKHQLTDSGARAIVVLDKFANVVEQVIDDVPCEHVLITRVGDMLGMKGALINFVLKYVRKDIPAYDLPSAKSFKSALQGTSGQLETPALNHDDLAFLQYTGGTTGVAKGAMLTHGNLVANMLQSGAWINDVLEPGKEVVITALPLYHIFALTANCLVFMRIGACNYLITDPRDMKNFVKELSTHRFTAITGVNTLFNGLLNTEGFDQIDFSPLKVTLGGGMAVQRAVAERWKQVTGVTLAEAYGLTETSPAVCINPPDLEEYNGSIGLPIPSTEVCVQDGDGKQLPIGEVGELCVRGPQVMRGYWQRPEETAKVMTSDGWLKTGDMAKMDENGYFYIVDRKKDMILVSGFNVYPNEIEDVAVGHEGVLEAAAIGQPDERCGEVVRLFIVPKDPNLTKEDVASWCKEHLTGYKRPKLIEFRDELPKSNVGKILRRELRDT